MRLVSGRSVGRKGGDGPLTAKSQRQDQYKTVTGGARSVGDTPRVPLARKPGHGRRTWSPPRAKGQTRRVNEAAVATRIRSAAQEQLPRSPRKHATGRRGPLGRGHGGLWGHTLGRPHLGQRRKRSCTKSDQSSNDVGRWRHANWPARPESREEPVTLLDGGHVVIQRTMAPRSLAGLRALSALQAWFKRLRQPS